MPIKRLIYIKFSVVMAIFSCEVFSMPACHEYFLTRALKNAVRQADVETVRTLLAKEIYSFQNKYQDPVVMGAIRGGSLEIVRMLAKKGADLSPLGRQWGNALVAASEHGNTEIVRYLLEEFTVVKGSKTSYDHINRVGPPALWWAARKGHVETVQLFLDKKIGLFSRIVDQWVEINGHRETAQMIRNKQLEVLKDSSTLRSPIERLEEGIAQRRRFGIREL